MAARRPPASVLLHDLRRGRRDRRRSPRATPTQNIPRLTTEHRKPRRTALSRPSPIDRNAAARRVIAVIRRASEMRTLAERRRCGTLLSFAQAAPMSGLMLPLIAPSQANGTHAQFGRILVHSLAPDARSYSAVGASGKLDAVHWVHPPLLNTASIPVAASWGGEKSTCRSGFQTGG